MQLLPGNPVKNTMGKIAEKTLAGLCLESAARYGKRIAFEIFKENKICTIISYRLMGIRARQLALLLGRFGVKKGDKVLILAENRPEWPLAWFGTALAGAVCIPLAENSSPFLIRHAIEKNSPAAICISRQLCSKIAGLEYPAPLIFIDSITGNDGYKTKHTATDDANISVSLNGIEKKLSLGEAQDPQPFHSAGSDDTAAIFYIGSNPQDITYLEFSSGELLLRAGCAKTKIFSRDRLLSTISLAHIFECTQGLLRATASGAMTIYLDSPPLPSTVINAARALKPTIILALPRVVHEFRCDFIEPQLKKDLLYRYAITRSLAYMKAGKKMLSALGKLVRCLEINGSLPEDAKNFLHKISFPVEVYS